MADRFRIASAFLSVLAIGAVSASVPAVTMTKSTAHPPAAGKPLRIMSMNMCNDLILLMLVPRERIASITYLAHDAVTALMPGADRGIAVNRGTSEEILLQKPDLILASPFSAAAAQRLGEAVKAPIVEVEIANDFDGIRRVLRQIGSAVGEEARAEALIRQMDADLGALAARRASRPLRVVAWTGDGSVPGRDTLTDAVITAAGGVNIGARRPDGGFSSFGLEELLAARPDAVMQGVGGYEAPSLRQAAARHPLIHRLFAGRQIDYPDAGYVCGLPQTARAARQLADAFAKVPRGSVRW
ncbi:MAG: ABC transporter substrate-binding protein [Sphingobium sp.]|nr:ABC transporter substrate-binding protein [Sphingobium sp.]